MANGKPVIRVFGRAANGKSVCAFFEGCLPYFYAAGDDVMETLSDDNAMIEVEVSMKSTDDRTGREFMARRVKSMPVASQVLSVEKVRKKVPFGYGAEMDMHKIYLKDPSLTPAVRELLVRHGAQVFEADIPFKYRWMTDNGLGGMSWVKVKDSESINTQSAIADSVFRVKEFESLPKIENSKIRTVAIDIECVPEVENEVPEASRDQIIMLSLVFSPDHNGAKSMVLATRPGKGVKCYDSEKEMLEGMIETIKAYDCDVITGFNINNFDIPYILTRMEKNGVRPVFGRCGEKKVRTRLLATKHRTSITGRMIVDSFEIVKKDFSLKRYGLDWVAPKLLGTNKVNVKHSEIAKLWKSSSREDFEKLVEYCRVDSVLAMDLLMKLNLTDKYIALSKVSGVLLQDILDSGETQRIENLLLREFNAKGFVLPCKPVAGDVEKRENARKLELAGGFVMEPKKGMQSSVVVLDFKSMYPSLIRTYNICPTTILKEKSDIALETPAGTFFVKPELCPGVVPKILETLMDKRDAAKKKEKEATDENQKRLMNAEQWALKIMANAFYGYFGYPRAKLYSLVVGNTVTGSGRITIQETRKIIETEFGYEVIYGDTDSVMVRLKTDSLSEMDKIGKEIARTITDRLPGVMELQFEKIFKQFLALTKKRYMGWSFEPDKGGWKEKIVMKGIETVRRDWCEFTSDTMKTIIEIMLKQGDVKKSVEYFRNVVADINAGKVPIEKLMITKTMSKSAEKYDGMQPHIELVKKIKKRGGSDVPGIGDRIAYVIVRGSPRATLSERAEDPRYVQEKGLQIDASYYIENQLLPPLERIFTSLGVSTAELLGRGRQIGLMDAFKAAKAEIPQEVRMNEVDGFICVKCRMPFRRPPLAGACPSCGGEILFSSAKGPARLAVA